MYKAYHVLLPQNLQYLFIRKIKSDDRVITRRIDRFVRPWSRTNLKCMCISIKGVTFWNALDESIIENNRSLHKFKKCIKKYVLAKLWEQLICIIIVFIQLEYCMVTEMCTDMWLPPPLRNLISMFYSFFFSWFELYWDLVG